MLRAVSSSISIISFVGLSVGRHYVSCLLIGPNLATCHLIGPFCACALRRSCLRLIWLLRPTFLLRDKPTSRVWRHCGPKSLNKKRLMTINFCQKVTKCAICFTSISVNCFRHFRMIKLGYWGSYGWYVRVMVQAWLQTDVMVKDCWTKLIVCQSYGISVTSNSCYG